MFEDLFTDRIIKALQLIDLNKLNELRLRVNLPIVVKFDFKNYFLTDNGLSYSKENSIIVNTNDIEEIISKATGHSLYAHNERLKNGYLITKSGFRIGVCGECVSDKTVLTIKNITSILIRVPLQSIKEINCQKYFFSNGQVYNSLIISPPGFGKTTLIKQVIKSISKTYNVLVVDERGELFENGVPADYLRFSTKDYAFLKGIRVMSPEVIVTDELMDVNDFEMCQIANGAGVKIIASIHAKTLTDVINKPFFKENVFDRYILLKSEKNAGEIDCVYDRHYRTLNE